MGRTNRVYLQNEKREFVRILWFRNNKPNEMLMGVSGLSKKQAVLSRMFPEIVSDNPPSVIDYKWSDAVKVDKPVDHITCHADGTFHIKTTRQEELYTHSVKRTEALGPETAPFLDFIVFSDHCRSYKCKIAKPRKEDVAFGIGDNHVLWLRGIFAGVKYPLEDDALRLFQPEDLKRGRGMITLTCGTIKGILIPVNLGPPPDQSYNTKPPGTLVSFNLMKDGRTILKTFIFS